MSNRVIPKEQLSAYQRWEMDALDEAVRRRHRGEPRPGEVALPTAQDIEQIQNQAHQEGFNVGLQQGRAKAEAEAAEMRKLLSGLREALTDQEQRLSEEILSVALAVARQIISKAVAVRPDLVLPVIREAIETLPQASHPPKLILHPADAALLHTFLETHKLQHPGWKIVENPHLGRGGCQVESTTSEIDATLEARWKRVITVLGRDDAWLDLAEVEARPTVL